MSKHRLYLRVVEELNLDVRDPFTNLFANACALADLKDELQAENARLRRELSDLHGLNAVNESGCERALQAYEACGKVCKELTAELARLRAAERQIRNDEATACARLCEETADEYQQKDQLKYSENCSPAPVGAQSCANAIERRIAERGKA